MDPERGSGGVVRAHYAPRRSGQLRRMVDRRGPREGEPRILTGDGGHGLGDREDKDAAGQGRSVVVRSAAMVVARTALIMVAIGMRVGHAIVVRCDFPVLVSMGDMGHRQHGQAGQPEKAPTLGCEHERKAKPGTGPVKSGRKVVAGRQPP